MDWSGFTDAFLMMDVEKMAKYQEEYELEKLKKLHSSLWNRYPEHKPANDSTKILNLACEPVKGEIIYIPGVYTNDKFYHFDPVDIVDYKNEIYTVIAYMEIPKFYEYYETVHKDA